MPSAGIKSYVLRRGRITVAQTRGLETLWASYGIEIRPKTDWESIFGRRAPLSLEIGGGYGEAAAELAQANPQDNHIVLEVHTPGVGALLNRLSAAEINNVRVARADAVETLPMFNNGELSCARIFFPDPWPKKRHHKRRLITPTFVKLLAKKVACGGIVHIATDWANYACQIRESFASCKEFTTADNRPLRPPTRFAARASRENRAITDLAYCRCFDAEPTTAKQSDEVGG